jgi:hypothetical protein
MSLPSSDLLRVALTGIGATAILDLWLLLLRRLGVPTLDFALLGRWVGHWPRGVFRHAAIARAEPVPREAALGWSVHYATGVGFAALLAAASEPGWFDRPTPLPALAVGVATVAAPWLLMQPAMGAGFAAARTPNPAANRFRSLANHAVFGAGLYLSARLLAGIAP